MALQGICIRPRLCGSDIVTWILSLITSPKNRIMRNILANRTQDLTALAKSFIFGECNPKPPLSDWTNTPVSLLALVIRLPSNTWSISVHRHKPQPLMQTTIQTREPPSPSLQRTCLLYPTPSRGQDYSLSKSCNEDCLISRRQRSVDYR